MPPPDFKSKKPDEAKQIDSASNKTDKKSSKTNEVEEDEDDLQDYNMPLPRYFADLYEEFGDLKRFDLKDVIYDKKIQELFMEEVREQIESSEMLSAMNKKEVWKSVKETKFPIIMGIMNLYDASIDFACGSVAGGFIQAAKMLINIEVTKIGLKQGSNRVR